MLLTLSPEYDALTSSIRPTYATPCYLTFKDACGSCQDISQLPSQGDMVCCLPFLCAEVRSALNLGEQSRRTKSAFSAEKKQVYAPWFFVNIYSFIEISVTKKKQRTSHTATASFTFAPLVLLRSSQRQKQHFPHKGDFSPP